MIRKIVFPIVIAAVLAATIGVVVFFVYTLTLRNDYKETAMQINQAAAAYQERAFIRQGETRIPATADAVNFYDSFLLDGNTAVYSREAAELTEKTIWLEMGDKSLAFTGLEDGSAVYVLWRASAEEKGFRVRSKTTFMQLEAYFQNYARRQP